MSDLATRRWTDPRQLLFAAFVVVTAGYLVWRVGWTLNPASPVYSGVFLAAEAVGAVAAFVFYAYLTAPHRRREPPPPPEGLEVDVFIATYNEDLDLLRTTAVAARDMHYPHRTWLCDDGRRDEVRALAEELGIGYFTREDNVHFKAGNLNAALARTEGDLVVVLDADHVPRRQLLERTLGWFRDDDVAFVQPPQVYYNVDSFQHALLRRRRQLWHESAIFHHAMQPGADRYDAAFFVGTGAVLRRTALEEIDGFATGSITEDIHTSLRLHAAGYRSVYVDEALGYMLAADTPLAYAVQRMRWAQGSMQLLRWENPLWKRGLTGRQRVGYVNAMGTYLLSWQHLVFYAAPVLYLLFGASPIALDRPWVIAGFFVYIGFGLITYRVLAAPHGRLFLSEVFKLINLPVFLLASLTLLEPQGLRFQVTPKGDHAGLPWPLLVLPVLVTVLSLTATGVGLASLFVGADRPLGAVFLTTPFAAWFGVVGAVALLHAFDRRENVEPFAFPVRLVARVTHDDRQQEAVVDRMSLHHAYLRWPDPLPAGTSLTLELPELELDTALPARVTSRAPDAGDEAIVKVAFGELPPEVKDALDTLFFEYAVPSFFAAFRGAPEGPPPQPPPGRRGEERGGLPDDEMLLPVRPGML